MHQWLDENTRHTANASHCGNPVFMTVHFLSKCSLATNPPVAFVDPMLSFLVIDPSAIRFLSGGYWKSSYSPRPTVHMPGNPDDYFCKDLKTQRGGSTGQS